LPAPDSPEQVLSSLPGQINRPVLRLDLPAYTLDNQAPGVSEATSPDKRIGSP